MNKKNNNNGNSNKGFLIAIIVIFIFGFFVKRLINLDDFLFISYFNQSADFYKKSNIDNQQMESIIKISIMGLLSVFFVFVLNR